MANSFKETGDKAQQLLTDITAQVDVLNKKLIETVNNINKLSVADSGKNQNAVKQNISNINQEIQKTKELDNAIKAKIPTLKQLAAIQKGKIRDQQADIAEMKKVAEARKKAVQGIFDEQKAIQSSRDSLQKQKQAALELSRSYNQLLAKQLKAKKVLQDLIVTQGKNSVETKRAQAEYDRLSKKINQANAATSNFSKRGLGSMVMGFKNLLGAFGIVGGVYMLADFAKATINTIKELDQLNYTLRAVVKNNGDLIRTKLFLIELTEKYGVELLGTTNRYVKFNIAARQAGLSLKETERIFSTVTEASALLGLKTDEVTGVYLALEQMLSKGKVTTEELRRQLGERLPGAFDLMAKALGKTTSELDKMLRAGDVISKEALPKLADEIRSFYGLTGEGIDTLQTATGKLSSAWSLLVEAMDNSTGVGGIWKSILSGLANGMNDLRDAMIGLEGVTKQNESERYYKELSDNIDETIPKHLTLNKATKEMSDLEGQIFKQREKLASLKKWDIFGNNEETDEAIKALGELEGRYDALYNFKQKLIGQGEEYQKELIKRIVSYKDEYSIINDSLDLVNLQKMSVDELEKAYSDLTKGQAEAFKFTIPYYQALIDENNKLLNTLKANNEEDIKKAQLIHIQNAEYQKQIELIKGSNKESFKGSKNQINALKGSLAYFEKEISLLETKQKNWARSSEQWDEYEAKIRKAKDALKEFVANTSKITINYLEGLISDLESEQKQVATNQREWNNYQKKIDEVKMSLSALNTEMTGLESSMKGVGSTLPTSEEIMGSASEKALKDVTEGMDRYKAFQEQLGKLKVETDDYLKSFSDDLLAGANMDSISIFFDGTFDALLEGAETTEEKFAVTFNAITESAQQAFNLISQFGQENFDAQYDRLAKQKEVALMFAGDSAAAREQIEDQYEERRKVIQRREAQAKKRQAIVNIAFDTAQGIVATIGKMGMPAAIPFIAAVGAIGLAQTAIVASQKIPEFFRGTENAPEGWALVDEKRPEIHTDRQGNIKSTGQDKANYRYLESGDKIYKSHEEYFNKELNGILSGNDIVPYNKMLEISPMINIGQDNKDVVRGLERLEATIRSKDSGILNIDKNGIKTYVSKGHSKRVSLNNRVTFKGTSV